jgi:hypothetical protein
MNSVMMVVMDCALFAMHTATGYDKAAAIITANSSANVATLS